MSSAEKKSKAQIKLDQDTIMTLPGATSTLTASVTGGTAADTIAWASSDETVAVVKDGTVIATGTGACIITAGLPNGKTGKWRRNGWACRRNDN